MRLFVLLPVVLFPVNAQQWSAWRPDATFPCIEVRERCSGFNEFAKRTMWDVELRNTYPKSIDLAWQAEPGLMHGPAAQTDYAAGVKSGETIDAHHSAPKE